ncbi:ABC transporter permease subunit [Kosmotoga pacifica]|uniref:Maltose/maltodextrin transport system permease protein n=1 Tax=Kosmotoga pacifica TaxID=1330330 RepID=A0A0G2Z6A8_9BACT|nr:ABC transporter permease subunit [Kosmotoga pacifica]AKI97082.1 maltose ABC transporter permease [Kosmotoga pacifica]
MDSKRLLGFIIVLVLLSIFGAFGLMSVILLWANANYGLAVILGVLLVSIAYILINPKGYPYRYMIPAMILLFILTVYPMYYTLKTAFTNFGTGHLFTRPQVIQKLLSDYYYVPDNPVEYDFSIYVKLEEYRPTDDFIVLFRSLASDELFIAPRPDVVQKDSKGNILLAESRMFPVINDKAKVNGKSYQLIRSALHNYILSVVSDTGERYMYFYSPGDSTTKSNAPFYLSEIRGIWLKNAEFTNPDGQQVRLNPNKLFTNFATSERKYGIKTITSIEGGRTLQKNVVYNKKTGRVLTERDGFFYDIDDNGQEYAVEGYISDVGFKNFLKMLKDPRISGPFVQIFAWTFTWAALSVLFTFVIGLALALVLNDKKLKGTKIYRTLLIIPWAIPAFISVLVWKNGMFNETYGIINRFIVMGLFGAEKPIKWLSDPFWAKVAVLLVNTWLGFPYMMTITLGALQSIPDELYEAASIDGATGFQRFRKITFPLLMIAVAPLLVGSFSFNFNNFVGIYLLTGGGPAIPGSSTPAGATDILISYTYKLAFEGRGQDFGFASAISILIFVIVGGLSWLNFKLSGAFEEVSR